MDRRVESGELANVHVDLVLLSTKASKRILNDRFFIRRSWYHLYARMRLHLPTESNSYTLRKSRVHVYATTGDSRAFFKRTDNRPSPRVCE
jgi:hypothetical protein